MQRGSCFNVWDWFDTGISAYWCPGSKTPELTQKNLNISRAEGVSEMSSDLVAISPLVAPWRRIMYVCIPYT